MQFTKQIVVEVGGRLIPATVTVNAPGLDPLTDFVSAPMLLSAVANNQDTLIRSRHHKDRDVRITVTPPAPPALRLAA